MTVYPSEHPILFMSKALSKYARDYAPTELGGGCLVWTVHKLKAYLDGNNTKVILTIVTDHQALKGT
jgi:hypothetical protein